MVGSATTGERAWARCPVCGGAERSPYVAFAELEYSRCRCGAVYKSRERDDLRPADFYESDYFQGRKSGRERRFPHRVRKAMRQIEAALELLPARSVLDIGCSLGYVVAAGARLGLRAAGCDVSEYAVRVCRERGLEAHVGELDALPFGDGAFDLVVMKHVLEHTPDPLHALAEVSRVSGAPAALIVVVPDLDYWKGRLWRRRARYFRPDDLGRQHYVYYTLATLTALLGRAGYTTRFGTKAIFRRRVATRGPLWALWEVCRFATLWTWQALARRLRLRRELFVVATRS
jgi:SAM-dependent methyltransferase